MKSNAKHSVALIAPSDYESATSYIALASTLKSLGLVDGNIHVLASYEHRETLKDASLSHIPIIGDNVEEQLKSSKHINDAIAKNDYERLVELTRNKCRNVAKSHCHSIMNFLEHHPPSFLIDGTANGYFGSYALKKLRIPSARVHLNPTDEYQTTSYDESYNLSWKQLDHAMKQDLSYQSLSQDHLASVPVIGRGELDILTFSDLLNFIHKYTPEEETIREKEMNPTNKVSESLWKIIPNRIYAETKILADTIINLFIDDDIVTKDFPDYVILPEQSI